jgi:hypothetical protein
MDSSNSKKYHTKAQHSKRPEHNHQKKWDTWDYPLDLPLPKLPAIPSLTQHKAKVHHNQQDVCMKELELMKEILEKVNKGIYMNLLAFQAPNRIYNSD